MVVCIRPSYQLCSLDATCPEAASVEGAKRMRTADGWQAMSLGRRRADTNDLADAYKAERARLLREFGMKLRTERERRDLSQEALAAIANIHRTQLSALELGLRDPHLTMLLILADGLRIPPHVLLEDLFVPRERRGATHSKGA